MSLCGFAEDQSFISPAYEFSPAPLKAFSESARAEYWATLALRHCPGIGIRTQAKLLAGFGSAYLACKNPDRWLEFVGARKAEEFRKETWREGATKEWREALKSDCAILLWRSQSYPAYLRELTDPPSLLYCKGNLELLSGNCVGIVGTRNPTGEGKRISSSFARTLSNAGITVVSGMAMGIDRAAHLGAMMGIGSSIGVLGTGIDWIYPRTNKDIFEQMYTNGLLISEFAPATPPIAKNFPVRNRIISGLSLGVIVVEAATRSGSLVTARLALEQNREVFAVPGPALSNASLGCQNLIRQGARAVFCAEDILKDLAPALKCTISPASEVPDVQAAEVFPLPPLSDIPQAAHLEQDKEEVAPLLEGDASMLILECLQKNAQMQIEEIAAHTGLHIQDITTALLGLELTGQILRHPGGIIEAV